MDKKKFENVKDTESAKPREEKRKGSFADRAGDVIEKVGHKVADAGAPKLGQKIHDMGDRLEKNHDNKNHPHRV